MVFPGISGAPLLIKPPSGMKVQDVFNVSLWTGTGAARTITTGIDSGEGSLVWIKGRTVVANHQLYRGIATLALFSDTTSAETTLAQGLTATAATGYSLGTLGGVNGAGNTYVGWQFRRAPNFFDIVQYTGNGVSGRTIAHSLGIAPGMVIVKRLNAANSWVVQHTARGAQYGILESTTTFIPAATVWPGVANDISFVVGNDATVNASGDSYIAYLFAHDPSPGGIIQCGSYVGNGSATGPVVTLGWRPQYLMIKNATATGDWQIIDSSRGFTAANDAILLANTSGAETTLNLVNPNSTGFQIASTASNVNTNGQTYIYMAIREA